MAAAKKVLIHLGAPKTGTSYLEKIIWGNQNRLLEDGVWMPGKSRWDHDALMGDVRGKGIWHTPSHPWTWSRMAAEARERDDSVLVSKEMLSGIPQPQVEKAMALLDGLEVHLVITCRALSSSLPSIWQQTVKANSKRGFSEWLGEIRAGQRSSFWRYHDPVRVLRRWGSELPAEQLHVISMPPTSADPTLLWRRFASVIGVDPERYTTPDKPANESLGAIQAELLRLVNVALDDDLPLREPYRLGVHRPLIQDVLLQATAKRRFGVPAEHHAWVEQRSQQMIEDLKSFPCTFVGEYDDLLPRLDPDAIVPDALDPKDLLGEAVDTLATLLRRRAAATGAASADAGDAEAAEAAREAGAGDTLATPVDEDRISVTIGGRPARILRRLARRT